VTDLKHLWNRGPKAPGSKQNWFLRLPIPRSLRMRWPLNPGKMTPAVIQSLDTGDLAMAQRKRERLIVTCRSIFDRLAAGEQMSPDDIKAALAQAILPPTFRAEMFKQMLADTRRQTAEMLDEWERRTPYVPPTEMDRLKDRAAFEALRGHRVTGETISTAAEAWFTELQRDPSAAVKATTLEGHRLRVRAFVEQCGDVPLATVTRAMASDFLAKIAAGGLANRTVNNYATTLSCVFTAAKDRGRFSGENPFERQKRKAGGGSYEAFTPGDIHKLFAALPGKISPAKHTPDSALPWAVRIAAYTGMRLEEIAQLNTSDIREVSANGATVTVIDIHNGGSNTLKNESSARVVPIHSELVRTGLLDYVKALPEGSPLFPGLKRRASKGGKIGARLGELFRKQLIALGMKRDGLCFHSFRHTAAQRLEAAGQSQTDAARILGHAIAGESYGTYSSGPGLKRLAAVVEAISYE
jgi:integrase